MKKPKKDYCVGHVSGQGTAMVFASKGWNWKVNQFLHVQVVDGTWFRHYRIKVDEIAKLLKKHDFKVVQKRVHKYLEVEREG